MKKKTIAICNITFHDRHLLEKFKDSVKTCNYNIKEYYHDNTLDNLGYATGFNICIEKAYLDNVDYLYIGNADVELHPEFLDTIIPLLEKNPRYLLLSGTKMPEVEWNDNPEDWPKVQEHKPKVKVNFDPDMSSFVIKRETIDILRDADMKLVEEDKMLRTTKGIFFEEMIRYLYHEDDFLKNRIYLAGFKFAKVNHAMFNHVTSFVTKSGKSPVTPEEWVKNEKLFLDTFGCAVGEAPWRHSNIDLSDFIF